MNLSDAVIIIPSRLSSTRLPNKPLADIAGKPMIIRVAEQAYKSQIGEVIIACGDKEIFDVVKNFGYNAVMTDPSLACGTDRIYAAFKLLDLKAKYIINLQGDLPIIDPTVVSKVYAKLISTQADIATAAAKIIDQEEIKNPNVVKAIIGYQGKALYFTRAACPYGEGDLYHHIGIYAYTYEALEKFMHFNPSPLEKREKLEQLRALENGLSIFVEVVDTFPIGVDTPDDLEKIRRYFAI
jgi:3-deoxy-manno-octulosonate cytidylyltransferase (CMP-KDO synthetase)